MERFNRCAGAGDESRGAVLRSGCAEAIGPSVGPLNRIRGFPGRNSRLKAAPGRPPGSPVKSQVATGWMSETERTALVPGNGTGNALQRAPAHSLPSGSGRPWLQTRAHGRCESPRENTFPSHADGRLGDVNQHFRAKDLAPKSSRPNSSNGPTRGLVACGNLNGIMIPAPPPGAAIARMESRGLFPRNPAQP